MLEMLQFFITHLRDLLCHAMKHFYFLNEPAKYVNLDYIYMHTHIYFRDFKALPGDAAEKQSKGWAAGQEYVSQKSAEEDKAVLYAALFQIRDASEK